MRVESETTANVSLCLFLCAGRDFVFWRIACFPWGKRSFRALCEVSVSVSAGPFRFIRTVRTAADSGGQRQTEQGGERVAEELPLFCRCFSVSDAAADGVSALHHGKCSDCRPRLTRSNALHFTPCWRAEIPPGKKIAYRAFSRLWRVCAKFAQAQPTEFSAQAKQAARLLPGV